MRPPPLWRPRGGRVGRRGADTQVCPYGNLISLSRRSVWVGAAREPPSGSAPRTQRPHPAGESREGAALFGGGLGVPPNPYSLRFPPGKWTDLRSRDVRPYVFVGDTKQTFPGYAVRVNLRRAFGRESDVTEILCYDDSYLKEFDATVVKAPPNGVVLDRTAFYPGGGGQPSDTGVLVAGDIEYPVSKVSREDGDYVHRTDGPTPEVGSAVHGKIDWDHRYELMRTHTALHTLCGIVWRDYGAKVTGSDMKPLTARMDFELEHMTADFAQEIEEAVNRELAEGHDVAIATLPREEAFRIPDLIRTKINLLPDSIKEVRTVDIVGIDIQADGGTHVANTDEVGRIKVVKHESKGRINKRLRIEVVE